MQMFLAGLGCRALLHQAWLQMASVSDKMNGQGDMESRVAGIGALFDAVDIVTAYGFDEFTMDFYFLPAATDTPSKLVGIDADYVTIHKVLPVVVPQRSVRIFGDADPRVDDSYLKYGWFPDVSSFVEDKTSVARWRESHIDIPLRTMPDMDEAYLLRWCKPAKPFFDEDISDVVADKAKMHDQRYRVSPTVWSDVVVDDMSCWTGPSPHSLMPSRQKSIPMCRLPLVTWALPGKVEGRRPKFDALGK